MTAPRRQEISSPNGALRAEFVPEAGMVCCSLRRGERELLAQRRGLEAYAQQGKTMGIPLLYPWANRLAGDSYEIAGREVVLDRSSPLLSRDPNGLPIHGVIAGRMRWRIEAPDTGAGADESAAGDPAVDSASALTATLRWGEPELLDVFPFPHLARYEARLDDEGLAIAVEVQADGGTPVPVSFGFHPYVALAAGTRASAQLEIPVHERLELDGQMIPTGARTPFAAGRHALGEHDWDEAFAGPGEPATFVLHAGGERTRVEFAGGFGCSQVFSPHDADFVCVEPMTAPANALRSGEAVLVGPGERYRARFRLSF